MVPRKLQQKPTWQTMPVTWWLVITLPSTILSENFLNRPMKKVLYSGKILRKGRIMVFHVLLRHELIQIFNVLFIHLLINSSDFPAELILGDVGAWWGKKPWT